MLAILAVLIFLNYSYYFSEGHLYYTASYQDIPGILFLISVFLTVVTGIQYLISNREILIHLLDEITVLTGFSRKKGE